MNAVIEARPTKPRKGKPPKAAAEPTSLLQVIERVARDPEINIEKMERLLEMQRQITQAKAEAEFNAAMSSAQSEMGCISADANNQQTSSRYASYAQLDKYLRPIYTKHGFALSFDEADSPKAEHIRVVCHVSHRAGFTRTYHRDMPVTTTGLKGNANMTLTHANASGQSYAMRYLLKAIFNVAVGEDDDDGNGAGGKLEPMSDQQLANIQALITEVGTTEADFLKWVNSLGHPVGKVREIPASAYLYCVRALEAKRRRS